MLAAWLAAIALQCNAPPGVDELVASPAPVIAFGEMHGTAEAPAAVAAIACELARHGPVTVALELPTSSQPALDAFLVAETSEAAQAALAGTTFADNAFADGRTSVAMMDLLEALRRLRAEDASIAIRAIQPGAHPRRNLSQAWYELQMANEIALALGAQPDGRVILLTGNIHARKAPIPRLPQIGLPAVAHLPAADVLSFRIGSQGGAAWNCQPECGPHPSRAVEDAELRGFRLEPDADGAFDGVLFLGPTTASPPAASRLRPAR